MSADDLAIFNATDARANLSDLVNRVGYARETVGLSVRGSLRAVMIDPERYARLRELEEAALDAEALAHARRNDAEDDGTRVSLADLDRALDED